VVVKTRDFKNTVFAIDEPELHLNTAIQRKLLKELVLLIPENCQLWVATHSVGFLRALQTDLQGDAQVIDFSAGNYFEGSHVVRPMAGTRTNWQRVFQTALEDLTGLMAPSRIVYCEGRAEPNGAGTEQGVDAQVLNTIFEETHHETLFVSSGGGDVEPNASLALRVLSKAFTDVALFLLKDRDDKTDAERTAFLVESPSNRMLERREIENYLYDKEIVSQCAVAAGIGFDEARYDAAITDIRQQDLKLTPLPATIQGLCGSHLNADRLKVHLSSFITPETAVYAELEGLLF
jgi:hypothetical protein